MYKLSAQCKRDCNPPVYALVPHAPHLSSSSSYRSILVLIVLHHEKLVQPKQDGPKLANYVFGAAQMGVKRVINTKTCKNYLKNTVE